MAHRSIWIAPAALLTVNGLNFLYFLLLARNLEQEVFIQFSYAAAVVSFSLAIAEAGVIYAAPAFLRARCSMRAARVTGGFLLLSYSILSVSLCVLAMVMSMLRAESLSVWWLLVYLGVVGPNVLLQPWILIRFSRPLILLAIVAVVRSLAIPVVGATSLFASLVAIGSLGTVVGVAFIGARERVFRLPRVAHLRLCLRLVAGYFVLRIAASVVTSAAPFLLGMTLGPAPVAAYLLGDRTRALVSTIFQPIVQAYYLVVCRRERQQGLLGKVFNLPTLTGVVALSCIVTVLLADWINQHALGNKYPESGILALFIMTGHVSVLASLGYLIKLIPVGLGQQFVRGGVMCSVVFLVVLSFSALDPIRVPAIAALIAESFFCVYIWIVASSSHRRTHAQ